MGPEIEGGAPAVKQGSSRLLSPENYGEVTGRERQTSRIFRAAAVTSSPAHWSDGNGRKGKASNSFSSAQEYGLLPHCGGVLYSPAPGRVGTHLADDPPNYGNIASRRQLSLLIQ